MRKVIDVEIYDRLPRENRDQGAECKEGAERDGCLAALTGALARDDRGTEQDAREHGEQQRSGDCRPSGWGSYTMDLLASVIGPVAGALES